MTLRDQFAIAALPETMRHVRADDDGWWGIEDVAWCDGLSAADLIAEQCYLMADAMLAKRRASQRSARAAGKKGRGK
jgi:hypothetical protein